MTLSAQEITRVKELKAQQYTTKEIAKIIEQERSAAKKANAPTFGKKALEFGKGVVKSAGETIVGGSNLVERTFNSILSGVGLSTSDAGTLLGAQEGGDAASKLGIGLDKMQAKNEYQKAGKMAESIAEWLIPGAGLAKLETKAAVGLAKYLPRAPKIAKALSGAATLGIEGATAGGLQVVKKGKPDESAIEAAAYGAIGAGVANTIGASIRAIRDFGTSGIGQRAIGQLKRALPNVSLSRVKTLLTTAQEFADKGGRTRPTDVIGEAFYKGITKVRELASRIGDQIGDAVEKLNKKAFIALHGAPEDLMPSLTSKAIKLKNGALDFSESELKGLPDAKIIREFWDEFFKPSIRSKIGVDGIADQSIVYQSANPRALLAGIRRISNKIYSEDIKQSGFKAGKGILEQMRQILKSRLDDYVERSGDPELLKLNKIYSEIYDALPEVEKMIGVEGQTAAQILRRIESNAGGKVRYAVEKLQEVAGKNGIKDLDGIVDEITLANVIEDAFGVVEQNSLAGQIRLSVQSGQMASNVAQGASSGAWAWVGALATAGADVLRGSTKDQLVNFIVRFYKNQGKDISAARASGLLGAMGGKARLIEVVGSMAQKMRRDSIRRFTPVPIDEGEVLQSTLKEL